MEKRVVIAVQLTKDEYDEVRRKLRYGKLAPIQKRWLTVMKMRYEGASNAEIIKQTGYTYTYVCHLLRRFRNQGLETFLQPHNPKR